MPSLLLFLLGLCMWLNFQQAGTNPMFLYWPVLLVGLTICILFFPAPIIYHRSREWWAYSNVSSLSRTQLDLLTLCEVSITACWTVSCRIQRFLPWRYVLFPNIFHGGKLPQYTYYHLTNIVFRTLSCFFVYMRMAGTIRVNAIRPIHGF